LVSNTGSDQSVSVIPKNDIPASRDYKYLIPGSRGWEINLSIKIAITSLVSALKLCAQIELSSLCAYTTVRLVTY